MTQHKLLKQIGFYALVVVIVVFSVFPFYYAIVTSFTSGTALFQINYWPKSLDLSNYRAVLTSRNFLLSILNSLIIATATVEPTFCPAMAFWKPGTTRMSEKVAGAPRS